MCFVPRGDLGKGLSEQSLYLPKISPHVFKSQMWTVLELAEVQGSTELSVNFLSQASSFCKWVNLSLSFNSIYLMCIASSSQSAQRL